MNGETARDVDTLVSNVATAKEVLKRVLPQHGIDFRSERPKGNAWTLDFNFNGHHLEMDLLDPSTKPKVAPGVDCDVGNFAFDKNGLRLMVNKPNLVSLGKSVKHCQSKKFVFYRQLPSQSNEERRLTKYMNERGWVCKTLLPNDVVQMHRLKQSLLKPKAKYSKPYWTY